MKIIIIIPTYNRKESLKKTLDSLLLQNLPVDLQIQIVVVADGSSDGSLEMLSKDYPDIHVVKGTGDWWYTKCINEGLNFALTLNPDYFLTFNDDIFIDNDYLSNIYTGIKNIPKDSLLGSISLTMELPHKVTFSGIKRIIYWRLKEIPYLPRNSKIEVEKLSGIYPSLTLSGRGLLIPIKVFDKLGFYDEKFVQYGSDTEYSLRAIKNKVPVYVSYDSKVYENHRTTSKYSINLKPPFLKFAASYFNKYSVNSITKSLRIYRKYCYSSLMPLYFILLIIGIFKIYLLRIRND